MAPPLTTHWIIVKRILMYLSGTIKFYLTLLPLNSFRKFFICAYSDNDWTIDVDDKRFTSKSCLFFVPI